MSLKTRFGNLGNILDFDTLTKEDIYVLNSPILSNSQFNKFINFFGTNSSTIDCTFSKEENLSVAIERIQKQSEIAVRQGVTQLILSDKSLSKEQLPMPMLLCVGAINTFLTEKKLRGYVSIIVQSGEALDTHSFAVLIGVGATTVNPYLAIDSIHQRFEKKLVNLNSTNNLKIDFGVFYGNKTLLKEYNVNYIEAKKETFKEIIMFNSEVAMDTISEKKNTLND